MKIQPNTRKRLKVWAAEHELSYDEAINELLDHVEADNE